MVSAALLLWWQVVGKRSTQKEASDGNHTQGGRTVGQVAETAKPVGGEVDSVSGGTAALEVPWKVLTVAWPRRGRWPAGPSGAGWASGPLVAEVADHLAADPQSDST
jgi:hypothetical protein